MDILGPFPTTKGQVKFLLFTVDYFTKWIEAKTLTTIIAQKVQKFTWKKIICKYGIMTDNKRQFMKKVVKNSSSISHPWSSIPKLMGKQKSQTRSSWVKLPSVL